MTPIRCTPSTGSELLSQGPGEHTSGAIRSNGSCHFTGEALGLFLPRPFCRTSTKAGAATRLLLQLTDCCDSGHATPAFLKSMVPSHHGTKAGPWAPTMMVEMFFANAILSLTLTDKCQLW